MTCRRRIPRPSLMWMSIDDVMRVRNHIIGLYLAPGQEMKLAPPDKDAYGMIVLYMSASTPVFEWRTENASNKYWLRYDNSRKPYWDHQHIQAGVECDVSQIPFGDSLAYIPATIVKHLSRYFPFVSTDNYLVNGGKPIA